MTQFDFSPVICLLFYCNISDPVVDVSASPIKTSDCYRFWVCFLLLIFIVELYNE